MSDENDIIKKYKKNPIRWDFVEAEIRDDVIEALINRLAELGNDVEAEMGIRHSNSDKIASLEEKQNRLAEANIGLVKGVKKFQLDSITQQEELESSLQDYKAQLSLTDLKTDANFKYLNGDHKTKWQVGLEDQLSELKTTSEIHEKALVDLAVQNIDKKESLEQLKSALLYLAGNALAENIIREPIIANLKQQLKGSGNSATEVEINVHANASVSDETAEPREPTQTPHGLRFLCFCACGEIKPSDMIYKEESNTLECPKCKGDSWYICLEKEAIIEGICKFNNMGICQAKLCGFPPCKDYIQKEPQPEITDPIAKHVVTKWRGHYGVESEATEKLFTLHDVMTLQDEAVQEYKASVAARLEEIRDMATFLEDVDREWHIEMDKYINELSASDEEEK